MSSFPFRVAFSSSVIGFALLPLLVGGCANGPRVLMPTPNLYAEAQGDAFPDLSLPLKRTEVRFLYVTDREPADATGNQASYGSGLSASLALGTAVVDLGTNTWDELAAAIRELTIEARAGNQDPREHFRLHNLGLAAPDLDVQVATQRLGGDRIDLSVHRLTVYTWPADSRIGVASALFATPPRASRYFRYRGSRRQSSQGHAVL